MRGYKDHGPQQGYPGAAGQEFRAEAARIERRSPSAGRKLSDFDDLAAVQSRQHIRKVFSFKKKGILQWQKGSKMAT